MNVKVADKPKMKTHYIWKNLFHFSMIAYACPLLNIVLAINILGKG